MSLTFYFLPRFFLQFVFSVIIFCIFSQSSFGASKLEDENPPLHWTSELMMKTKLVKGVQPSPDGKQVVYTVTEAVMTAEKSEFVTQIFVANTDGSSTVQMTFGEKSSTNPQWSPDGKYLAFTSNRFGQNNLFVLRLKGGEAKQLTDLKSGIEKFTWSPDGKQIAYIMLDPPTEEEEKKQKGQDDSYVVNERIKMNRLYVISIEKNLNNKSEPRKLTAGNFSVQNFDWSPDGKTIVFSHWKTPSFNDWITADVSVVDVISGRTKPLAVTLAAEDQPLYSPDGKFIALTISSKPPKWTFDTTIHFMSVSGGTPKALTLTADERPNLIGWTADGINILFAEPHGTVTGIYSLNIEVNKITELSISRAEVYDDIHLNSSRTNLGFTLQTSRNPTEAYVSDINNFSPIQVSNANIKLLNIPIGKTELIKWKSTDGMEIEGLLSYPVNYEKGKKVPLLLQIHGGPAAVYQQTFLGDLATFHPLYPLQAFTAQGYAVLRANPRGSDGYGAKFRNANYKDWGGKDFQDLMAGVDDVIQMGIADPNRLGVMGWSYGGFMTAWVVTHTNRFKAASIGAPVIDLISFAGTTDITTFLPYYFGNQFCEDLEIYRAHSPISFVKGVTTPSQIQQGSADVRVPISQGYEFYNALKARSVTTRMIVLPRQPHRPIEPKMVLKILQTNFEWFGKYIGK